VNKELLSQFRWFQNLTEEEAGHAADDVTSRRLKAGEVLFRQGDPGDSMFMVLSGTLETQVQLPSGRVHTLSTLEKGAIFGETSLLLEQPRRATAVAKTDAELCCITHADFVESLQQGEAWAGKFLMSMCRSLARRLCSVDADLVGMIAREEARSAPKADELDQLRTRLLTEWNF
jgi:CRP-like cAMP-binding protein